MDHIDARLRQLEVLANSIVTALREERKALEDAKMQFEKVGENNIVLCYLPCTLLPRSNWLWPTVILAKMM